VVPSTTLKRSGQFVKHPVDAEGDERVLGRVPRRATMADDEHDVRRALRGRRDERDTNAAKTHVRQDSMHREQGALILRSRFVVGGSMRHPLAPGQFSD